MSAAASARAALTGARPRPTVRLRLTMWYSGLYFLSGVALLAITYALVVQSFTAGVGPVAVCGLPGSGCHTVSASHSRAVALQEHAAVLHELLTRSAAALAVTAVLSVVLGWLLAGRALRPLRTITTAARQMSAADLGERLAMRGADDELKELGDTFDGLLARLEASFTAQRQFIANAAHELRTPLARQRVISQVALADPGASAQTLRAAHERVLASGDEQQHLIDALLTLARGQAGLEPREQVDLATVMRRVMAVRRADADQKNLTVRLTLRPALTAGCPRLIEQLAANLVDNALRHNRPGGQVDIVTGSSGALAILSVANTGSAVPADAVDRLFQPFQRLGDERVSRGAGLGLGLTIVRAIADTHHAALTAGPRPGGGLKVEVSFTGTGQASPLTTLAPGGASMCSEKTSQHAP